MKHISTIILFCLLRISVLAQTETVAIHPIIGDTISQQEKTLFLLFPEMPDSTFNYAVIYNNADKYWVDSYINEQQKTSTPIDTLQLQEYRSNIDKLLAYYSRLEEINTHSVMNGSEQNMVVNEAYMAMSPAMKQDFLKNAKRYRWLKMQGQERGLHGVELDQWVQTQGFWASDGSKKKKKKKKKDYAATPNGIGLN